MMIIVANNVRLQNVQMYLYVKEGTGITGLWDIYYGKRDMDDYEVTVNGETATKWKDLKDGDFVAISRKGDEPDGSVACVYGQEA